MTSYPENENAGMPLAITGAFLMLVPALATLVMVFTVMNTFRKAGIHIGPLDPVLHVQHTSYTFTSGSDPRAQALNSQIQSTASLASSLKILPLVALGGTGLGLIGIILLMIAIFGSRYRAPWLFWYLLIYGILALLAIPVGTIIGIGFLAIAFTYMDQFLNREQAVQD